MARIHDLSAGWTQWRWLSGVQSKEKQWFLGTLRKRAGYAAWSVHMTQGLGTPEFLLLFEETTDPWQRSKLVGEKIGELRKSFRTLTDEQKTELARQGEVELKAGLSMLGRDKQLIAELVQIVDPPPSH